jgi:TrmH family RNA methyltransferase
MHAMEITSRSNPRLRAAARLRDRGARKETGLTLVDGAREVQRSLELGVQLESAFICPGLLDAEADLAVAAIRAHQVETFECTKPVFELVAFGDRAEGIVAVVRAPAVTLQDIELPPAPLVVVTEDVEKPGNLGAILRSADGAGVDAVIAIGGTDLYNPNVIRASVATVFALPVVAASADETAAWLRSHEIRIVATVVEAALPYSEADLRGPLAIVLGSEADGVSATWRTTDVEAVSLPMLGVADSLNVSATAAVLLYEARRQRGLVERAAALGIGG